MPFKSKAQQRFMFAAQARGDLPKGTAERWAKETPNIKKLPERKKKAADLVDVILQKMSEDKGQNKIDETMTIYGKQGINVGDAPEAVSREVLKFSSVDKNKGESVMKKTAEQIADEVMAKVAQPPTPAQIQAMRGRVQAGQQQHRQGMIQAMGGPRSIAPRSVPQIGGPPRAQNVQARQMLTGPKMERGAATPLQGSRP